VIRARRLEADDLPARVQWFNSPAVYEQMAIDAPLSLSGTRQWYTSAVLSDRRRDFTFEDVSQVGRLVAMGGLTDISRQHGHAELYIVVNPELHGRGFGSAAVRWLCNYGFIQLGLHRIYLHTMGFNDGARRLYERLGFVSEGMLRQHTMHHGHYVDRFVHGLLRTEWANQSWAASRPLRLEQS